MKEKKFKLIGASVASVIVLAAIFYSINIYNQFDVNIEYPKYEILNFGSYDDFNNYLQNNSENQFYRKSGDSFALPSALESEMNFEDDGIGADSNDYSQTNIQELGVDEPDIVKTDGTYLFIISNSKLYIIYAFPAEDAKILSTIIFNQSETPTNLFVKENKIAVITQTYAYRTYDMVYEIDDVEEPNKNDTSYTDGTEGKDESFSSEYNYWQDTTSTYVKIYDVSNHSEPQIIRDVQIEGYYSNARMVEEYLYIITTQYAYEPVLYMDEDSTYIPKLKIDGESKNIAISDIYYIDSPEISKTLTNIVSVNIIDKTEDVNAEVIILGNPSTIYVSSENIYITSIFNNYDYNLMLDLVYEYILPALSTEAKNELDLVESLNLEDYQKTTISEWIIQKYADSINEIEKSKIARQIIIQFEKTIIHKITINSGDITYNSQGSVPGYVNNQFSISEYNGNLRVATTVNGWMMSSYLSSIDSYSNIYILDESLEIIGSIENIAQGEEIYSVRFFDDICYVVTFKQIDPFFVIDLQNPYNPKILGELKIPGYSTYLHPYDQNNVIGLGKEDNNVKVSLFNVEEVSNPLEISTYQIQQEDDNYHWSYSTALYEHKAFLFDKEKELLVIPVSIDNKESAYVFNISKEGIELKGIITHESKNNETNEHEPLESSYWKDNYGYSIKRSLYIEDIIYTISDSMVKMNNLISLTEINDIILS